MSIVAHKNYLADKKPFYKHFQPRDIAITAVRSVAIQGLMVFNGFVASLDLEEDEDDSATEDEDEDEDLTKLKKKSALKKDSEKKEEFVPPSANDFGLACLTSFVKSLSITTCIRSLEEVAILYLRPQIVGKLVKDLGKAAMRKYARTHSRLTAGYLMFKTGMRGNVLGHISIFLVEEAHQAILILYRRYKKLAGSKRLRDAETKKKLGDGNSQDDEDEQEEVTAESFLQITAKNATRSSLAVVTGGLGAAVGTVLRPGLGTVIGATLGDTIAYMI